MGKALTIMLDGEVIGSNFDSEEATDMAGLCSNVASQLLQQAKEMREQAKQVAEAVSGNGEVDQETIDSLPELASLTPEATPPMEIEGRE